MNRINFAETFGPKATRKKPKLSVGNYEELANFAGQAEGIKI